MTQQDLDRLEELANKATPGRWYIAHGGMPGDHGFSIASKIRPGFGIVCECWPCAVDGIKDDIFANGQFISQMAPDTILSLIALARRGLAAERGT